MRASIQLKKAWNSVFAGALGVDAYRYALADFAGIHKNKRCFIVGNGPSLNKIDMSFLKKEITLGSNRVYLGFEKWGFDFKYWCIIDELHLKQCYEEYNKVLPGRMIKFVPSQSIEYFKDMKNVCPINMRYLYEPFPKFSDSPDTVYEGWSVTYALLQIAAIMGCNHIYLIGVDYNYNIQKEHLVGGKWTDPSSQSHFISNYCAADKGVVWNVPQFERTDAAYACAARWADAKGVKILNATPGSMLKVFEMTDYSSIFNH